MYHCFRLRPITEKCASIEGTLKDHEQLIHLSHVQRINIESAVTPGLSANPALTVPVFQIPAIGHSMGYLKDLLMSDVCEFVIQVYDQAVNAVSNLETCLKDQHKPPSEGFNPTLLVAGRDGYSFAYNFLNKMVKRWSNDLVAVRSAFSKISDAFLSDTKKIETLFEDRLNIVLDMAKYLHIHFDQYQIMKEKCHAIALDYTMKCNSCSRRSNLHKLHKFENSLRGLQTNLYHRNKDTSMDKVFERMVISNPVATSYDFNLQISDVRGGIDSNNKPSTSRGRGKSPLFRPPKDILEPIDSDELEMDEDLSTLAVGSTLKCQVRSIQTTNKALPLDDRRKKLIVPKNRKDICGKNKCLKNKHSKSKLCKFYKTLIDNIEDIRSDDEFSSDYSFDYDAQETPSSNGYSDSSDYSDHMPPLKKSKYCFDPNPDQPYELDDDWGLVDSLKQRLADEQLNAQDRLSLMSQVKKLMDEFDNTGKKLRSGNVY